MKQVTLTDIMLTGKVVKDAEFEVVVKKVKRVKG